MNTSGMRVADRNEWEVVMRQAQDVKDAVCDTAGCYDQFAIADVLEWELSGKQRVRDAVKQLVKEGLLERVGRGMYRWLKKG